MNKYYGFCKLITYKGWCSNGSLKITNHAPTKDELGQFYRIGVYTAINTEITLGDFNRIEEIPINSDTDSFQIRTKVVFKDKKGYYIKEKGKKSRLDDVLVKSMESIFEFEVLNE